jgi:DNA-binding transcriptional LysR family regulator
LEPAGSIEAVKRSVMASPLALGVLPEYALVDELRAGLAQEVRVRPALPRVRLEARLAGSRPLHPAAAELVEELRATLGRSVPRRSPDSRSRRPKSRLDGPGGSVGA